MNPFSSTVSCTITQLVTFFSFPALSGFVNLEHFSPANLGEVDECIVVLFASVIIFLIPLSTP